MFFRNKIMKSFKYCFQANKKCNMLSKFQPISSLVFKVFLVLLISTSCSNPDAEYSIETKLNPYKISPLTALLKVKSEKPCRVSVKVLGDSPMEHSYNTYGKTLSVPVLGLYPNATNKVLVTLSYEDKKTTDTIEIKTGPVPSEFPKIEINKVDRNEMEPGLHACETHFANHGKLKSIPFMFDDQGVVRWYLDLSFHGKMVSPFQRLNDGTILMVGRQVIYEFNMLGKICKKTQINNNYGMHHDVLELPSGNLLICVGKRDAYIELDGEPVLSDSDFIILYDRNSSRIIKEWDLAKHLDVARGDQNFLRKGDWLHMNGLAYDESDNSIIVSGRNQGLIKISWDNELQWILSPQKGWEKSGRKSQGFATKPFLLSAVDSKGAPFDKAIQDGDKSAEYFDFPWAPHAPAIHPNGNLLVFDNGFYRNYSNKNNYSRAAEYEINKKDKTATQVWQYGKSRGSSFYSSIISDVDFLPKTNNILVTSGFITPKDNHSAKIVEVDYESGKEVFEATIYFKNLNGNRAPGWGETDLLYRSERMELNY